MFTVNFLDEEKECAYIHSKPQINISTYSKVQLLHTHGIENIVSLPKQTYCTSPYKTEYVIDSQQKQRVFI